jgi:hypothetical protein
MQLSFLGQPYEAPTPVVGVSETQETITFMGKPYARKQYHVEQPQAVPEELTFMGQRYVRAGEPQPQAYIPRPGELRDNGRKLLQMQRSRATGRCHPAFRGS